MADVWCEASYFNEQLSVWEPLLEPLELEDGRLQPWNLHAEVNLTFQNSYIQLVLYYVAVLCRK